MNGLTIKKFPDPSLRKCAEKITKISASETKMLSDMAETMYLNEGVGLAATQVGIAKQLAVIDVGVGLIKMINPVIVKKDGLQVSEEGCLSVPGAVVKVKRAARIVVNFLDENGNASQLRAEGLLARAIQHELDHLSGKVILDHLSPIKKLFFRRKKP